MGEPLLAQALRLLEEGRDREALVFLQPPQEGLPEAERLGRADSVRLVHADFVSGAPELPDATNVTLRSKRASHSSGAMIDKMTVIRL